MARPILLVLLDGAADRAYTELGGLTPLEAAPTPHLDALACAGASGFVYPLGPGVAPPSELPHFHLFGYPDFPFPGRAVLEALGHGVDVPDGVVVAHAGLRAVTRGAGALAIDDWLPGEEGGACEALLAEIERFEAEGLRLTLQYLARGDALLRIEGDASEWITDSDPFFFTGLPVLEVAPMLGAPDAAAAARTAAALNAFLRWAHATLDDQVLNRSRRLRGARPLNMVVTKWTGRRGPLPPFARWAGVPGVLIASAPLYAGLAALLGLRHVAVPERGDPEKEMIEKLEAARAALAGGAGFVHVHTKAADEAAHAHSPAAKRDVLAAIDRALGTLVRDGDLLERTVIAVTCDHATPSAGGQLHSGDSVPLVVAAPTVRCDGVASFGERAATRGGLGQLRARDVLPLLLDAADRARFTGGRLTPEAGPGAPSVVTPLDPGR